MPWAKVLERKSALVSDLLRAVNARTPRVFADVRTRLFKVKVQGSWQEAMTSASASRLVAAPTTQHRRRLRQSGKYTWPGSYWVTIVPDLSRKLLPGQASLVLPGIGPLKGRAAIARVPCGKPSDVPMVEFVGDELLADHHIGSGGID